MACLLKGRIGDRQLLLENGSANTPVATRWSNKHLSATVVTSYNNRRAVDGVFCVVRAEEIWRRPADSLGSAVGREAGWCEMTASLIGRERGSRGTSTVRRSYPAAHWRPWMRTSVCVWQWFVKCSNRSLKSKINPITNPNPVYSPKTRDNIFTA
jgi:hypothetical protein